MNDLTRRGFLAASGIAATGLTASAALSGKALAGQPEKPAAQPQSREFPGDAHRGACVIASVNGLRAAARAREMLAEGYDPADACVQGVKIIEDDPADDSVGIGGLPNEEGIVELDASVMHGPTHKSGAVAGIRDIKNPAMVALLVLRRTDHCLLVGEGAKRFALSHGFREENLLTERARLEWLAWKENHSLNDDWLNDDERDAPAGKVWDKLPWQMENAQDGAGQGGGQNDGDKLKRTDLGRWRERDVTGTVHCSAVTAAGDVASVTSTSGLNWKIPGRVGDSPIIGAGNYCDNAVGAAGCTGRGEAAIVNLAAYTIVSAMERGMTPTEACLHVAKRIADRTKEKRLLGAGGKPKFNVRFYALRKDGAYGCATMYAGHRYAVADSAGAREMPAPSLFEGAPPA